MIQHHYNGTVDKKSKGYLLYNQFHEWNITDELKSFWQTGLPIHIRIENNKGKLMDQTDSEIYYDRNEKGKYQFHVNDVNVEDVLERAINKQIYITVDIGRDIKYGTANIHNS